MRLVEPISELVRYVAGFKTQGEAARALGISQAYLSDMLHGHRNITHPILEKLGLKRVVVR